MAGIPLNTFKTYVKNVQPPGGLFVMGYPPTPGQAGNANFLVYTAPLGVTSVILYAQVANKDPAGTTYPVRVWHYRPNLQPVAFTEIVYDIPCPTNDALSVIGGKLVLETGDSLYVSSTDDLPMVVPGVTDLKLTISILESANQ